MCVGREGVGGSHLPSLESICHSHLPVACLLSHSGDSRAQISCPQEGCKSVLLDLDLNPLGVQWSCNLCFWPFSFLIITSFSKPAYFWQSVVITFCKWLALIFILKLIWTGKVALEKWYQRLFPPPAPNALLHCTLLFLNYRRFHHVHMQGVSGWLKVCHFTTLGKHFAFDSFVCIWKLLFVRLSGAECPCVQALPLLNSCYYLALEGHASCFITRTVMKQGTRTLFNCGFLKENKLFLFLHWGQLPVNQACLSVCGHVSSSLV